MHLSPPLLCVNQSHRPDLILLFFLSRKSKCSLGISVPTLSASRAPDHCTHCLHSICVPNVLASGVSITPLVDRRMPRRECRRADRTAVHSLCHSAGPCPLRPPVVNLRKKTTYKCCPTPPKESKPQKNSRRPIASSVTHDFIPVSVPPFKYPYYQQTTAIDFFQLEYVAEFCPTAPNLATMAHPNYAAVLNSDPPPAHGLRQRSGRTPRWSPGGWLPYTAGCRGCCGSWGWGTPRSPSSAWTSCPTATPGSIQSGRAFPKEQKKRATKHSVFQISIAFLRISV